MKLNILKRFYIPLILLALLFGTNIQLNAQEKQENGPIHYVFPTFIEGTVIVKSGKKLEFLLNYNKITQEMVIDFNEQKVSLNKIETVDTAIIQNRIFVPVDEVFYEIALNAKIPLYIQHKVKASKTGKAAGYGTTSQTGAISSSEYSKPSSYYDLELSDDYLTTEVTSFWVEKEGSMFNFRTKKQFLKIFDDHGGQLKTFIKKNKIDFNDRGNLVKLLEYCNQIVLGE